jgi:hypothetical protein
MLFFRSQRMRKKIFVASAVFFISGLMSAQTLDDVLAKYYQSRGGLEKLQAVSAVKMSGKLFAPAQGLELPTVRWQKAPDKLRVETTIQDKKVIQGFDGRAAWWFNPMLAPGVQEMPKEQAALFREQAEFADPRQAGIGIDGVEMLAVTLGRGWSVRCSSGWRSPRGWPWPTTCRWSRWTTSPPISRRRSSAMPGSPTRCSPWWCRGGTPRFFTWRRNSTAG